MRDEGNVHFGSSSGRHARQKAFPRAAASAREFRVILLCPTVLSCSLVPNGCYAVPSGRSVVKDVSTITYLPPSGESSTPWACTHKAMLPFYPTGNPIPGVLRDAQQFAFMWGVVLWRGRYARSIPHCE